ncbi:MAG TPA: NADH-quinone oxidoreductase subunit J [Anaerolineales bacterium]|nr:NADH-quinone oxidoreductase subunit J [Anaerolineales bacterium]
MENSLLVFLVLAAVAVASAIGMLLSRNAVYAALFLILNFLTIAVFYLFLGGVFIAMTQVTVYAGAIMVLFLFVIMLLGAENLGHGASLSWQRPLAVILAVILIVEAGYILLSRNALMPPPDMPLTEFGSPQAIGTILFDKYLLPFEATSVLLLIAMIGALVLTRKVKP